MRCCFFRGCLVAIRRLHPCHGSRSDVKSACQAKGISWCYFIMEPGARVVRQGGLFDVQAFPRVCEKALSSFLILTSLRIGQSWSSRWVCCVVCHLSCKASRVVFSISTVCLWERMTIVCSSVHPTEKVSFTKSSAFLRSPPTTAARVESSLHVTLCRGICSASIGQ